VIPDYILGDFDSIDKKVLEKYKTQKIKINELKPEKDFTDTEEAINLAIKLKSSEFVIIGAIGTRIDHVLANINVLKIALDNNIKAQIINEHNEIELINNELIIEKNNLYKYISIMPLTTQVEGITITGMKYPLENYTLTIGNSLGVSNEQIEKTAKIKVKDGILIVIKSRD
jgi:thiamine pyrophosphokinase